MILLLNLKAKKSIVQLIFDKESKLIKILLSVIKASKSYNNSTKIAKVFCNLFLDEYKEIYFSTCDPLLEDLFIINNEKFSKINVEGVDVYPKSFYVDLMQNILNLKLTYEMIFNKSKNMLRHLNSIQLEKRVVEETRDNKPEIETFDFSNKSKSTEFSHTNNLNKVDSKAKNSLNIITCNIFNETDKPIVKLQFIQSLIRVVFSKEKYNYIKKNKLETNFIFTHLENFEYNFMSYIVNKSLIDTKQKYGDNYSCLFRKDEIYDEVIKYFFFIFGNSLVIKSFGKLMTNLNFIISYTFEEIFD